MVITTAKLHSTKAELRFCADSNPADSASEICDGEDLWQKYHKNNLSTFYYNFNHAFNGRSELFKGELPCGAFIKYIYYMFWYLKFCASTEWSMLFNKTSICSKVWFIVPGFFLYKTEDNQNVAQAWNNLKFLFTNFCALRGDFWSMHSPRKDVHLVKLFSEIVLYIV